MLSLEKVLFGELLTTRKDYVLTLQSFFQFMSLQSEALLTFASAGGGGGEVNTTNGNTIATSSSTINRWASSLSVNSAACNGNVNTQANNCMHLLESSHNVDFFQFFDIEKVTVVFCRYVRLSSSSALCYCC